MQTIIVAGGYGDIGSEIVRQLLGLGVHIIIIEKEKNGKFISFDKEVFPVICDVRKNEDLTDCMKAIIDKYDDIYGLINCVGVNTLKNFDKYSDEDIDDIISGNFYAAINLMRSIIPYFKNKHYGRIINISSQTGIDPQPYNVIYSASKAAVIALTKGLAKECAEYNISINSICPGDIVSEMMKNAYDDLSDITGFSVSKAKDKVLCEIPMKRFCKPEEVAELVINILFLKTGFLTGANIVMAGGRTCY